MKLSPSIFLEYGADEACCDDHEFEICQHGMRFNSRWQFEVGMAFRLSLAYSDADQVTRRITAEGLVVDCEAAGAGKFRVSLLFLNPSETLRAAIARVSARPEESSEKPVPARGIQPRRGSF